MKYLRLFWLWLKLPLLYLKRPYKGLLERECIALDSFAYYLDVKQQRKGLQTIANKIKANKKICLSTLLKQKCYDVLATDVEDSSEEIKKELEELIALSAYIHSCPKLNNGKVKNGLLSKEKDSETEKDFE